MKKCIKCGSLVNVDDKFCMNCGSSDFESIQEQTTVLNDVIKKSPNSQQTYNYGTQQNPQAQQPYNYGTQPNPQAQQPYNYGTQPNPQAQQPYNYGTQPNPQAQQPYNYGAPVTSPYGQYNQGFQPNMQSSKKSPLKKIVIILGCLLLACIVLVVTLVAIFSADKVDDSNYDNDYNVTDHVASGEGDSDKETSEESKEKIEYTKGEITDGFYINEWADLKVEITDEWPDTTEEAKANYEASGAEVGFASVDSLVGKQFLVEFVDLSISYVSYNETKFLDGLIEGTLKPLENVSVETSDYYDMTIAEKDYLCVDLMVENGVTITYCVSIYDGYVIVFCVSSMDETRNLERLNSIETINNEK